MLVNLLSNSFSVNLYSVGNFKPQYLFKLGQPVPWYIDYIRAVPECVPDGCGRQFM